MSALDRALSGRTMAINDSSYKTITIISIISRLVLLGIIIFETLNGAYVSFTIWLFVWFWLLFIDNSLVRFCSNHLIIRTLDNYYIIEEYYGGDIVPYKETRYVKDDVVIKGMTDNVNDVVVIVKTPEGTLYISK